MKKIVLLAFCISLGSAWSQEVLFLHHSTGGNVFYQGDVSGYIQNYNLTHSKSYHVTEFSYPNSPYPWDNYPYDFWNLWVNNACNNSEPNIMCLDEMTKNYDVIIWKHCFPGAAIDPESGTPSVSSSNKTLGNYKLQYRALLNLMDMYPDTKFIVWTLAPLHRYATSPEQAARAYEFADWVKNTWLYEGHASHTNVFVFDFFGNAAEMNSTPANGVQYCLKYEYEGDHFGSDSHPNQTANEIIGPVFADLIIDVIETNLATSVKNNTSPDSFSVGFNKQAKFLYLKGDCENIQSVDIFNVTGQNLLHTTGSTHQISTNSFEKGIYIVKILSNGKQLSRKFCIE